jgi:hypothetical protein
MIFSESRFTPFGIMRRADAGSTGVSFSIPHSANASLFPDLGIAAQLDLCGAFVSKSRVQKRHDND